MGAKMERVQLVAYSFPLDQMGWKDEIHTEIRVFGHDYWFENRRVKRVKSRNKENLPYDNCNFTMKKIINCGTTAVTKYEFAEFIARINESHERDNKCGSYLLLNNLNPSQPREAQRYLNALIHDQNSESNWSWGLAAAATVGLLAVATLAGGTSNKERDSKRRNATKEQDSFNARNK